MIYKEETHILKNGCKATFRSAQAADAKNLAEYMIKRAEETEFMLRDPDECESPEELADFIQRINTSEEDVMILCEVQGKIVGSCEMLRLTLRKTFHRASISMGTLQEYWGLGIGTIMLREMIGIARKRGITQMELNVFEGNERAMGLYKKMGFEVVAERPNCIHLKDGKRLKAYTMFLTLE